MVLYNAATKELTARIVYYGPGLGGKTTNLQLLHDRLDQDTVGKLLTLSTQTDRTIYFDLLPVEFGEIKGYKIRFQLATVPGQTAFNETRKVVLRGADGIVFVADSRVAMLPKNLESWQNLKDNLNGDRPFLRDDPDRRPVQQTRPARHPLGRGRAGGARPLLLSIRRGRGERRPRHHRDLQIDLEADLRGSPAPAPGAQTRGGGPGARTSDRGPHRAVGGASGRRGGLPRHPLRRKRQKQRTRIPPAPPPQTPGFEDRLLEIAADLARETQERADLTRELTDAVTRIEALEQRLDGEARARQSAEATTSTALASLSASAEKLFQAVAAVARDLESLQASLQEKTGQGLREAEDIRSQLAPLLEAHAEKDASERKVLAELDRLRESLADSLAEIAERLRRAVGEL